MRRRFGRGRRGRGREDSGGQRIDVPHWLERLSADPGIQLTDLSAVDPSPIPDDCALIGRGQDPNANEVALSFSPRSGADALLAGLAYMQLQARRDPLVVAAPSWSSFARQLLSMQAPLSFTLRATELPGLQDPEGPGLAETTPRHTPLPPTHLAALLSRDLAPLLDRCLAGLSGLAAKHGGALQSWSGHVDLVLHAERLASLSVASGTLRLETHRPDRGQTQLDDAGLAAALDRLEGSIRKYANDKRIRSGEGALRGAVSRIFNQAVGATAVRLWPLSGERQVLDVAGIDGEGRNFVGATRVQFGLRDLAEILEACWRLHPVWPLVMEGEKRLEATPPELLLAARSFDEAVPAALASLAQPARFFDLETARGDNHVLSPRAAWAPAQSPETPEEIPATPPAELAPEPDSREVSPEPSDTAAQRSAEDPRSRPPRSRSRGRGRPRKEERAEDGIEEVSLFDLDETDGREGESEPRTSSRRRGRRRGRRSRGGNSEPTGSEEADTPQISAAAPSTGETDPDETGAVADDDEIFALSEDAPDPDVPEPVVYEEEEPAEATVPSSNFLESAATPDPRPRRRRTAFVVRADRNAILAAVLMARSVRQLEGFWIYPQEELMTFFRSVATDLREDTSICVVGFTAAPHARDCIQAAALYRDRIDWLDNHDWPPEDLSSLREELGEDCVHVVGGLESPMPLAQSHNPRRSRFSDRLVDLGVGRFTLHDFERWGRVWWHRLGELVEQRGDQRAAVDPLLAGRPSDLAKEAARIPTPPSPPEVDWVSSRDFRLVHFSGYAMVVLDVPESLDLHLTARVVRERYGAQLSLAGVEAGELLVLAGDDIPGHRGFDFASMVEHLSAKYPWVETLPGEDRVARLRAHGIREEPGRIDEIVSEIAMGRSIVEA